MLCIELTLWAMRHGIYTDRLVRPMFRARKETFFSKVHEIRFILNAHSSESTRTFILFINGVCVYAQLVQTIKVLCVTNEHHSVFQWLGLFMCKTMRSYGILIENSLHNIRNSDGPVSYHADYFKIKKYHFQVFIFIILVQFQKNRSMIQIFALQFADNTLYSLWDDFGLVKSDMWKFQNRTFPHISLNRQLKMKLCH